MSQYFLQNRYQDSGWEDIPKERYALAGDAICKASELSDNAICNGMVRVVDSFTGKVLIEYAAGRGHDGKKSFRTNF